MTQRMTSARAIVLETLNTEHKHWTANEVYEAVKPKLPSVNRSTIYRALDFLSSEGHISVSDLGLGSPVYESIQYGRHHHLVCQECGQIFDLSNEEVGEFFTRIANAKEFKICTNHLILFDTSSDNKETTEKTPC